MRTILLSVLLSLPATSQFLVPDQFYRCPASEVPSGCKGLPALENYEGSGYSINYVEYRDSGKAWKPRQLVDALAQIEKARDVNGWAAVVVYVHGWKNNANEKADAVQDVVRFRSAMVRLASQYKGDAKTPPLVGIYLAWRGLTLTVEPFETLSYWPRRYVARKTGRDGMYNAVGQIVSVVNKNPEVRSHTRLFFVGHSFGSRVLENAADAVDPKRPGFMQKYRAQLSAKAVSSDTLPPADLIVYINAATASTVTRRTIKDWTDRCKTSPMDPVCQARPFWLAVTSTADVATGIILPVANAVFPAITSDGLRLLSAANTPSLHTHNVIEVPCPPDVPPPTFHCSPDKDKDFCFEAFRDDCRYCYEVRRVKTGVTPFPFWIMNVNGQVIKSHGDIWNENFLNMLMNILDQRKLLQAPL